MPHTTVYDGSDPDSVLATKDKLLGIFVIHFPFPERVAGKTVKFEAVMKQHPSSATFNKEIVPPTPLAVVSLGLRQPARL